MPEQTFRSPGFFEREIDLTQRQQAPTGVPAGVIGTSLRGPAFVPINIGSFVDFETRFGTLDPKHFGPYAVIEFLKNRTAVTFMRVLGAGANDTTDDIENTRLTGQVKNAGYVVTGTTVGAGENRHQGAVQFIVATHDIQTNETIGMPMFTDNDSFAATSNTSTANIVRAMIYTTSGTRMMIMSGDQALPANVTSLDDKAGINSLNNFKLILSSAVLIEELTASLNPSSENYIGTILNTNPEKFGSRRHLLYADFAVDDEVATVSSIPDSIGLLSGSVNTSPSSGDTAMVFRDAFGHWDTRFTAAKTTAFISQPFGATEYDLFHFEALDDGTYSNTKFKISIANLRGSTDPADEYGNFEVQVRAWNDTDQSLGIIEVFPNCTLNPNDENYVGRRIGDSKTRFIFDADDDEERRLFKDGKYPNKSNNVRIVMNESVERRLVPAKCLPFGFRGMEALKTTNTLTDTADILALARMGGVGLGASGSLSGSIVPPLPFRFKATRGTIETSGFAGNPGVSEETDGRLYWGVKLERNKVPLNSNTTKEKNNLLTAFSKLAGLRLLDVMVTGSSVDDFNENKFTLARVAFANSAVTELTGTVADHIRETAYIRNGNPDSTDYKVSDGVLTSRITLATLVSLTSSADFNRFTDFTKFTNIMIGGFDGNNILDIDAARMNDRASSSDANGGAESGFVAPGLAVNPAGEGKANNAVNAYRTAARIMTNPLTLADNQPGSPSINLLSIPGIRDSFVTDFVSTMTKEFGLALYLMDIVSYDDSGNRLFIDDAARPDVESTSQNFDSRAIDNNYVAIYFPDVIITDEINNRRVQVPASVAALAAIGFNDRVGYPWFAPAGFNRGALDFVTGVEVRLTTPDRDTLYDARINPIAIFPREGFVVWGQKTLQQARSALDRVNIRRLMLEIRRVVSDIARGFVFEQNIVSTRNRFITQVVPQLALVQAQAGIERFDVIMDERNNSQDDIEQNKLNGRIVVVPTRAVEFIAIDFVVTNAGVSFDT